MSERHIDRHIDHELRRVDDAFAMLRPGKELDERLDDLLDGRAAPTRSTAPRAAIAAIAAIAVAATVIAIFAMRDDASTIAVLPAPAPAPAPALPPAAPAPIDQMAIAPIAIEEDVRFIDVPMGRLEVRAPSTVDVQNGRAIVTAGSVRLFERGKAPRTLLKGQSIAWKLPSADKASAPAPGIDDAEIETMLAQARAHEARGAYAAAADVLADLLSKKPPARVADTVGFERASLLSRARNVTDACAALDAHARKFPASENAADVAALRARLACR